MSASKESLQKLEETLNQSASGLSKVNGKKMFGCHALWADDNVFALVWKHGRIGVKLPDDDAYTQLLAEKGSEPWKAGAMTMSHWVLVPETFHKKSAVLRVWTKKAHALALAAPPKAVKAPKKK